MATSQEVKDTYKSTLQDLTCNSKPLISVLTMLAEENVAHAKDIAEAIEEHLAKVRTDVKLPVLYLIDCIVKNVSGPYTAAFSANLATMFTSVFQVVDEKTRMEMFKLRQTWNDVFSKSKLYALDVNTNRLDPAWPVTAAPPNIHFNPKFLNSANAKITATKEVAKPAAVNPAMLPESTLDMQQQLLIKQKQLLELQQKKLELELLQTQVKLQEQIKKSGTTAVPKVDESVKITSPNSSKLLLKPEVAKQLLSDKKDDSAKAMLAQINQKFPNSKPITPVNNSMPILGVPSVRPPIRDPRLLRQAQQAVQITPAITIPAAGIVSLVDDADNIILSDKKGFRDEPKKPLSRIPLKSKRSSSPSNKSKSTSRHSTKSSSGSTSSLESPKKSSRSSSKSPSKSSSKYGKSKNSRNSDKRSKRNDRRSPKKDKGRNYRRERPISISPELDEKKDVDLRVGGPADKQSKHDKDTDLRTNNTIGNKRLSSEVNDGPSSKKNRAEKFDALFGSEDVDLRKLPNKDVDRPITPPAPIISNKPAGTIEKENTNGSQSKEPVPKLSLEVLRAKLANATNANKDSLQKSRLQAQADKFKQKQFAKKEENKIFITSAEEENIKSGKMTKAQETNLIGKMIAQIENQKLKEAKRQENEVLNSMMMQPISDDEFDSDVDAPTKKLDDASNAQQNQRFEPRFNREPQWKGKRGAFAGSTRATRGRADPWIRPLPQGPLWAGARPLIGPVFEEDACGKVGADPISASVPSPPSHLQDDICMSHENIKSINIDGEPRDILFYGETAIAFMSPDDPREISFQAGQRRVSFDDIHSYVLAFNDPYRDVLINGHCHRVRLGAPTREIYIDGKPHECFFGGPPIYVELDGKLAMIKIDGPAPQVKIGNVKRTDLVAGKVNLIVDAKTIVPIYLDGRTQSFEVDGIMNTLRFKNRLGTVLINDQPNYVEFGGLPKGVMVNGRKHFIRFSVLPKGVRPGFVNVKDMEGNGPPTSEGENSQDGCDNSTERMPAQQPQQRMRKSRFSDHSPDRSPQNQILNIIQQPTFGNLDNLLSIASAALPTLMPQRNMGSYQIEKPATIVPPPIIEPHVQSISQNNSSNSQMLINTAVPPPIASQTPAPAPAPTNPMLNINDLFQKLVATGIVTTLQNQTAPAAVKPEIKQQLSPQMPQHEVELSPPRMHKHEVQMKLISFDDPSSLKVRQPGLVHMFYAGMQCSSCGMRFAQENSSLYSQHLDWHFRQNRKGKKNIRKASSRRWYYSITDWNNYEEIEDLDEREKCYFENQQLNQNEGKDEENEAEIEIPSVPADINNQDPRCEVCQEKLEQFYNEDKEEWHLKMAIRVEDKTYHPLCYEDLQANDTANETMEEHSISNVSMDTDLLGDVEMKQEPTTIPGLDVVPDEEPPVCLDESSASKPNTPKSELDADMDETSQDHNGETKTDDEAKPEMEDEPMDAEDDDVIINEVEPERIVLDDYEFDENGLIAGVVVKQEPVDDGFTDIENFHLSSPKVPEEPAPQDESFMDIGEISEPAVPNATNENAEGDATQDPRSPLSEAACETAPTSPTANTDTADAENTTTTTTTTATTIVSSNEPLLTMPTIDGNLDCNNAGAIPTVPAGGMGGRIKINISKPMPVIAPKENKDNTSDVDNNIEPVDPTQPLPPGEEPVQLYLKPALQGIDLKQVPPVNKGSELTGLCSIM